ncbi:MAG: hypothetical protein CBD38_01180 [bacterium TMED178]|nr:MAG: hypothetical protein CBD38_01180 [bacterium TMED178]
MLEAHVQNAGILLPALRNDLEKTTEPLQRQKKYLYYFDLQCSIIIEQASRIAYNHLRSLGAIDPDVTKRYAFRDSFYQRWNPIGKALFEQKPSEIYVGFHTIEFFVDLFCFKSQSQYYEHYLKNPFSMLDSLTLQELFTKTPFYKMDRHYQYKWEETFQYKTWKHYYIYEYENFCPGSFMLFVRQWYAPQQYIHEKETVLQILRQQFSSHLIHHHQFGVSCPAIWKDATLNENLFQLYQLKKLPLSRSSMFSLCKIDRLKYTTRELCRMEYCNFGITPEYHWLEESDPLSPYFCHEFTLHGLSFQNVHQYVCFRLIKMFSKNILLAHQSSTTHRFQKQFSNALGFIHDRSIFEACQRYRNSSLLHRFLLNNDSFSNNHHVQEIRQAIQSWIGSNECIDEKLLFLCDCFDFCQWNNTLSYFERLRELFYPMMKKNDDIEMMNTGDIYSEIPSSIRHVIQQYIHSASVESFSFPRRFYSHFLHWFSACEKSFRDDCVKSNFSEMLITVLKRHRYLKEKSTMDVKALKKHFSPGEFIMIKQIF